VFSGTFLPRLVPKRFGYHSATHWKYAAVISFIGVRGVVSLLAALAIPEVFGEDGTDYRSLILVATLCVIILSIVAVDVFLPHIVRRLGLSTEGAREADTKRTKEIQARIEAIEQVLQNLQKLDRKQWTSESLVELKRKHEDRRLLFRRIQQNRKDGSDVTDYPEIQLVLIGIERDAIARLYADEQLDDDARRRIERELDLEDTRLRHISEVSK
jgi:NhaP-type Na+/H+ and K+/H+ antiporter